MTSSSSSRWPRIVGTAAGLFLGAVLLFAAWAKAIHPEAFARQIELEGLDVVLSAGAVALIAIVLEVAFGGALVLGIRKLWVLVPTALLVLFFLFLTGRAYWKSTQGLLSEEEAAACGCFGSLVERTPAEAFWQDLLLLVPALGLAFVGRTGTTAGPLRLATAGFATAGMGVLAWMAPELPLDDLATRLKPGVEIGTLCAGAEPDRLCLDGLVPELDEGRHWVVLADLESEELADAVPALNDFVLGDESSGLWVVTSSTLEAMQAFQWQWGPAFSVREAPPTLVTPLVRRLPRSFEVAGGRVTATHSGLPPWVETRAVAEQAEFGSSGALD